MESPQTAENIRVLSIQSHVVHGYVGNKCAVFALQTLGVEVDPINTVQFSNNTGYPSWKGQVLQADQLLDLFAGLNANQLAGYSHILTGYVNSAATLDSIMRIVQEQKAKNPGLKYFCDPVMGDGGQLYKSVPLEMIELYKTKVLPNATVLFPNQTEAELLTGIKIATDAEAFAAMDALHGLGVSSAVVLKSLFYRDPDHILIMGSQWQNGEVQRWEISVPRLPLYFTGTGDLFSALALAYSVQPLKDIDWPAVCHKTVSAIQAVLGRSKDSGASVGASGKLREIKLVQSRNDILSPTLLPNFKRL